MRTFILFDLDGTLISTGGMGVRAMEETGKAMFGSGFSSAGIEYAGRMDPLIIGDLLVANGVTSSASVLSEFRSNYERQLERRLAESPNSRALPGVHDLLDAVFEASDVAVGVLTGNFPETGKRKMRACRIDPERFGACAWGDDAPRQPPSRDQLPPVAMSRFRGMYGRDINPAAVTVVGDTPHDVSCAQANGCRSIAVATGRFSVEQLRDSGADHVLADLSDLDACLRALDLAHCIRA